MVTKLEAIPGVWVNVDVKPADNAIWSVDRGCWQIPREKVSLWRRLWENMAL